MRRIFNQPPDTTHWRCIDANTGQAPANCGALIGADDVKHVAAFCEFSLLPEHVSALLHLINNGCRCMELRVPKVVIDEARNVVLINVKEPGELGDQTDEVSKIDPVKRYLADLAEETTKEKA